MGTPALAVPSLDILRSEHDIVLAVTQPDKPAGRSHQLAVSPVKRYAQEHGIAVSQPERARNEDFIAQLREVAPDAIAVVAYGQILPRAILELAPKGCVNLHFSLLPRWRGAAPVQYAILNGDTVTGVTTQWMAEKLDSGDVILQREVEIEPQETTGELWERLTPIGAETLCDTMRLLAMDHAPRVPQDETQVTWASTLSKENGQIDWAQPALSLVNRVRACNPWPGAWCQFRGHTLKIWRAAIAPSPDSASNVGVANGVPGSWLGNAHAAMVATGEGILQLIEVQPEGKPRLDAAAWARGARLAAGETFSI